jgi:hypothetical protein
VRNNVVLGGALAGISLTGGAAEVLGNTVLGDAGPAITAVSGVSGSLTDNAVWQQLGDGPPLPAPTDALSEAGNAVCDAACWVDVDALDLTPAAMPIGVGHPRLPLDLCDAPRTPGPAGAFVSTAAVLRETELPECVVEGYDSDGGDTGAPETDEPETPETGVRSDSCGCDSAGAAGYGWLALLLLRRRR